MKLPHLVSMLLLASSAILLAPAAVADAKPSATKDQIVTLIHTGDFHGHLIPRPNVRSDAEGKLMEGGLARVYTVIHRIRKQDPDALLIHTGDTIQGSAEVLYTRGQAIVDVVNEFKIDAFAPGNWEFVYGTERFLELFSDAGGNKPIAPWGAVAANVFRAPAGHPLGKPCPNRNGERVLPPYLIKQAGKSKVGIIGLTTDRGPQVVGSAVTAGLCFLKNGSDGSDKGTTFGGVDSELADQVKALRGQVDVLVLASEMGLANNIRLAKKIPGIDAVLSSDMHEESVKPVTVKHADGSQTLIVEEGQDGTMLGRIRLHIKDGKVGKTEWQAYSINSKIKEDKRIAKLVADVRKTFVTGPDFYAHVNPFNGTKLKRPIDTVVGYTDTPLHRSNFSHEGMPAVIEGSSHDFLTDAFRTVAGADIGAIRGFRYGTHVRPGPIKMEDLYHFIPIGPQIAKADIKGKALKNQIENAADGSLNPDVTKWTGGWLFNFSGLSMDLDPYQAAGQRAFNIKVGGQALDPEKSYSYASYWYKNDPCLINVVPIPGCKATDGVPSNVTLLKDDDGSAMDAAEVVVRYLEGLPKKTAHVELNRITLKDKASGQATKLPHAQFGFSEVQPLCGAATACP